VPCGKGRQNLPSTEKLRWAWSLFSSLAASPGPEASAESLRIFCAHFFWQAPQSGRISEVREQRIQPFQYDIHHNLGGIVSGLLSTFIFVDTNMIYAPRQFGEPFFDSTKPIWWSSFSPSTKRAMSSIPPDNGALLQEQFPNPAIGQRRTGVRPCLGVLF
jgi:hypothetical protein